MLLGKKIRLELNNKQVSYCLGHAGVARHAYNNGLAYCNEKFNNKEKLPSAIDLHKWLVATIKPECSWYYDYSKCSPQEALRNLEKSYTNFWRNFRKTGKFVGLPKFKKKGINDSFYLEGNIQVSGKYIKLPKFGWLKCYEILPNVIIKNVTISRKADEWFISFKYEKQINYTNKKNTIVGVDLGIKTLATLSNGEVFNNLRPYKNAKIKLRKKQKEVSRRFVKGAKNQSSNYKKSVIKLSKQHKKISDVRLDSLHKITSYLAKEFETVVIENLKVSNMVKNHNLASAILDGGFFEFKRQLTYKKQMYGGKLIIANTFFPSSKLCNCCGYKNNDLKLSDREWICGNCNTKLDRDLNASLNLKNIAVSSTVLAFGDKSSIGKPIQFVDELGINHQMFTFV